jgi:hypothetical protein
MASQPRDHGDLTVARDEVEAVGGDQPVEIGKRERLGQVGHASLDRDLREPRPHDGRILLKGSPIAIDRDDPPTRPQQVGEREGERPLPRPDVRPRPARRHCRPHERDVIRVIHR